MAFGTLLIFDCKECNHIYFQDKNMLQYFIDTLIKIMNMKAVGKTVYEYFPPSKFNIDNDLVGFSITQIISMSSITIHICEGSKKVYIDIFTCCNINDEIKFEISNLINKIFNPNSIDYHTIVRT
jgi:S-adenosylmethionine/arginine decarboxylase-like enzyme